MVKFWHKDVLRGMGVVLVSVVMSIISPFVVYASKLSEREMTMFSQNDIMFYDPKGGLNNYRNPCDYSLEDHENGGVGGGGVANASKKEFMDQFHEIAEKLSVEYGIPWETVMAQGIQESGYGTSALAQNKNNFFGIHAFEADGKSVYDNAYAFESPEAGWRAYYENIANTATYRNHGVFSGDTITDPEAYLQAITAAGYATENYANEVGRVLPEVLNYAREQGWKTSAELAAEYPEMSEHAGNNAGSGGSDSEPAFFSSATCSTEVNDVALELSWGDGQHDWDDPNDAYRAALEQVGLTNYGEQYVEAGGSCDAFLATVMRISGADPNFPCCGAVEQLRYLEGSGSYIEIENDGNTSNLQPGDIRANGIHVEIVVQVDGEYRIAAASHAERSADHVQTYYSGLDQGYRIFRRN